MHAQIAVIGGGIIGLCCALELQQRGKKVMLLERETVCHGASSGNAGHIATEQVFPLADFSVLPQLPKMLCNPLGPLRIEWRYLPQLMPYALRLLGNMRTSKAQAIHQALCSLNGASFAAWRAFAQKWQAREFLRCDGSLLVAEKPATAAALKKHVAKMQGIGIPCEYLEKAELHARAPLLAENQIGGIFYPETGHVVDVIGLERHLVAAFRELGGEVREHANVDAVERTASGFQLRVCDALLQAQEIVIATGAFSRELVASLSGIKVPLDTERGYHLMLPKASPLPAIPISSADRKFIMTPMRQGLRLAGTVEYAGLKRPPNMSRARNLLPLACGMLKVPLTAAEASEWMGFRPCLPDSLPVLDYVDGVAYAFGHQHLGLTQAVISAQMIADRLTQQPTTIAQAPFRLARFRR